MYIINFTIYDQQTLVGELRKICGLYINEFRVSSLEYSRQSEQLGTVM